MEDKPPYPDGASEPQLKEKEYNEEHQSDLDKSDFERFQKCGRRWRRLGVATTAFMKFNKNSNSSCSTSNSNDNSNVKEIKQADERQVIQEVPEREETEVNAAERDQILSFLLPPRKPCNNIVTAATANATHIIVAISMGRRP